MRERRKINEKTYFSNMTVNFAIFNIIFWVENQRIRTYPPKEKIQTTPSWQQGNHEF
jgi:hypothetical protein